MELADAKDTFLEDKSNQNVSWKSRLFRKRNFKPNMFQQVMMGYIIGLTLNEVTVHVMLNIGTDSGQLPGYINDLVFVSISLLETLLAPIICWYGFGKRKTLQTWVLLATLFAFPIFFLNFRKHNNNVFCAQEPVLQNTYNTKTIVTLVTVIMMALVSTGARLAVWAQGVAVIDNAYPGNLTKGFGMFIMVRVTILVQAKEMLTATLESRPWLQMLMLCIPLLIKTFILYFIPPNLDADDDDDDEDVHENKYRPDFFSSLLRVIKCCVTVHMLAVAILVAGVWGIALNHNAILLSKYNFVPLESQPSMIADTLILNTIIFVVIIIGYQLNQKPNEDFDKQRANKTVIIMGVGATVVMVVMSLLTCEGTQISGLGSNESPPPWASSCRCTITEASPVCVVSTLQTYLSPCHAGCLNSTTINGVSALTECARTPFPGTAIYGSCNAHSCYGVVKLQKILLAVLLTLIVPSLTLQAMSILKSVESRDRILVLSMTLSFVAFIAFVLGHLMFKVLSVWSCVVKFNSKCVYHKPNYGLVVGMTSAALTVFSVIINLTVRFMNRSR